MKANEFFKAVGIKSVKQFLENNNIRTKEMHDDLKRLVESHELANRLGGVDTMRIMIEQMEINDICDGMNISFDGEWQGVFTKGQLQQAIADVESCQ